MTATAPSGAPTRPSDPLRDGAGLVSGQGSSTAVVLYPVTRRQRETAALGFVTTRLLGAPLLIAAWELPLGGYLLVRGFGPDAVAALPPPGGTR